MSGVLDRQLPRIWTAIGILAICATFFIGAIGYGLLLRASDPFRMAMADARSSPAARKALGEPITAGLLASGWVGVKRGPYREANLEIPVIGPRDRGRLEVQAVKQAGDWTTTVLLLHLFGGVRIDLLAEAQLPAIERGCEAGNAAHCNTLGLWLSAGKEGHWRTSRTEEEMAAANRWFGEACDLGDADGCTNLGSSFENGWGVGKDPARAITLHEGACDGGHARACGNLGTLYMQIDVAEHARAASFLERGCAGGAAFACSNLGVLYEGGSGVLKDLQRSAALYEMGCDGGYPLGCSNLAELHAHGVGVAQDHARAAALFERACNGGDAPACQRFDEMKR